MKRLLLLLPLLLLAVPSQASESFALKMKDAGIRWTHDADNVGNFMSTPTNQMRLYTTAYVGSKSHEVRVAWDQTNLSSPWDTFRARDAVGETVFMQYQYNFE
jgi:hypothetical protein